MTDLEHEILFRVLRDDVDVVDGNFLIGFSAFQVFALYVFDDEMIVKARSVVKQHWQEEVGRLVMLALVASLLRKLLRLELEIAVVASRKQVLSADVVVMAHFWVRRREGFLAALTVGGDTEVFFLFFGERQHINLLAQYITYDLTFLHYVVVELRHGVRAAVHEWWSLVLRVLRHPIHAEAMTPRGC